MRRLVLAATPGGLDLSRFRAADWRAGYREAYPAAPSWILDCRADLSEELRTISASTLLLWGDADPISPVTIGEHLARLLPRARLVVIRGGTHALARDRAVEVAACIAEHLAPQPPGDSPWPRGETARREGEGVP